MNKTDIKIIYILLLLIIVSAGILIFKINKTPKYDEEIYNVILERIKEINKIMPKYKSIRGMILTETPLIKTTTNKIKRQANLDEINKT